MKISNGLLVHQVTFSARFLFSLRSLSSTSIFSIPESTSTWDMLKTTKMRSSSSSSLNPQLSNNITLALHVTINGRSKNYATNDNKRVYLMGKLPAVCIHLYMHLRDYVAEVQKKNRAFASNSREILQLEKVSGIQWVRFNTSSLVQSQFELLCHALSLNRSSERTKVQDYLSPLLAGGCVNVHALRAGQGLGLRLQAVRWRAGERTDALAALAAVSNPYSNGEHKRKHCVWVRTCWLCHGKNWLSCNQAQEKLSWLKYKPHTWSLTKKHFTQ